MNSLRLHIIACKVFLSEFLICHPGHTIQPSFDETKIKAVLS